MNLFTFFRIFNLNLLFFVSHLIGVGQSSVEVPRPRGVSLSRAGLYDPEQDFTCFDGSKTIPFNQVIIFKEITYPRTLYCMKVISINISYITDL